MNVASRPREFAKQFLSRRPSVLNVLHALRLVEPMTQTTEEELEALERHAGGGSVALEIGAFQGVSAARIAQALRPGGALYCVDPWADSNGRANPCLKIFRRHIHRKGLDSVVREVRAFSSEAPSALPLNFDFCFVDGDHSWTGIEVDWNLVSERTRKGSTVCLHDCIVPKSEPWRRPESVSFFEQVAGPDPRFRLIEVVHSMAIFVRQ